MLVFSVKRKPLEPHSNVAGTNSADLEWYRNWNSTEKSCSVSRKFLCEMKRVFRVRERWKTNPIVQFPKESVRAELDQKM
jgi:hypothetical protein